MKYKHLENICKSHIEGVYWNDKEDSLYGICRCLRCNTQRHISMEKKFFKCYMCNSVMKINTETIPVSFV